jgi:hypothetical protein
MLPIRDRHHESGGYSSRVTYCSGPKAHGQARVCSLNLMMPQMHLRSTRTRNLLTHSQEALLHITIVGIAAQNSRNFSRRIGVRSRRSVLSRITDVVRLRHYWGPVVDA